VAHEAARYEESAALFEDRDDLTSDIKPFLGEHATQTDYVLQTQRS